MEEDIYFVQICNFLLSELLVICNPFLLREPITPRKDDCLIWIVQSLDVSSLSFLAAGEDGIYSHLLICFLDNNCSLLKFSILCPRDYEKKRKEELMEDPAAASNQKSSRKGTASPGMCIQNGFLDTLHIHWLGDLHFRLLQKDSVVFVVLSSFLLRQGCIRRKLVLNLLFQMRMTMNS